MGLLKMNENWNIGMVEQWNNEICDNGMTE